MSRQLNVEWGARLRKIREERGLSQLTVATEAGIQPGYYSRIERGEVGGRGVGDDVRIRLAAALGRRVEQIFTYPDTTDQETSCLSAATAPGEASSPTPAPRAATPSPARHAAAQAASASEGSRDSE